MGYVYKITNTVNQKHYIGISIHEPESNRIRKHLAGHGSRVLASAVKKYGRDAFTYEILEENVFTELLPDLEVAYIAKFSTIAPKGYNLTLGGDGIQGLKHTEESREKMSLAHLGKTISKETREKIGAANRGKIYSQETREKISNALRSRPPYSQETREKIGAASRGKSLSKEHREKISRANRGRTHSQETCEKIGRAHRGKTLSSEHRAKLSEVHKGRKGPPHSEESRRKLSESHKKSPRAIEARRKLHEAQLSPERKEAHELYLSLPLDMDISEKRKLLREKFPDVNRKNIERWVRQWKSQSGY